MTSVSTFLNQHAYALIPPSTLIVPYIIDRFNIERTGWVYDSSTSTASFVLAAMINTVALAYFHHLATLFITRLFENNQAIEAKKSHETLLTALSALEASQRQIHHVQARKQRETKGKREGQAQLERALADAEIKRKTAKEARNQAIKDLSESILNIIGAYTDVSIQIDQNLIKNLMSDDTIKESEEPDAYQHRLQTSSKAALKKIKDNCKEAIQRIKETIVKLESDNAKKDQENKDNLTTLSNVTDKLETAEKAALDADVDLMLYEQLKEQNELKLKNLQADVATELKKIYFQTTSNPQEALRQAIQAKVKAESKLNSFNKDIVTVGQEDLCYKELLEKVKQLKQEIEISVKGRDAAKSNLKKCIESGDWIQEELTKQIKVLSEWKQFFSIQQGLVSHAHATTKKDLEHKIKTSGSSLNDVLKTFKELEAKSADLLTPQEAIQLAELQVQYDKIESETPTQDAGNRGKKLIAKLIELKKTAARKIRWEKSTNYEGELKKMKDATEAFKALADELTVSEHFYDQLGKLVSGCLTRFDDLPSDIKLVETGKNQFPSEFPRWETSSKKQEDIEAYEFPKHERDFTSKIKERIEYVKKLTALKEKLTQIDKEDVHSDVLSLNLFFKYCNLVTDEKLKGFLDEFNRLFSDYLTKHQLCNKLIEQLSTYNTVFPKQQLNFNQLNESLDTHSLTVNNIAESISNLNSWNAEIVKLPSGEEYEKKRGILVQAQTTKRTEHQNIIEEKGKIDGLVRRNSEIQEANRKKIKRHQDVFRSLENIMPIVSATNKIKLLDDRLKNTQHAYVEAAFEYENKKKELDASRKQSEKDSESIIKEMDSTIKQRSEKGSDWQKKEKDFLEKQKSFDRSILDSAKAVMMNQAVTAFDSARLFYLWKKDKKSKDEFTTRRKEYEKNIRELVDKQTQLVNLQCQFVNTPHQFQHKHQEKLDVCQMKAQLIGVKAQRWNLLNHWRFSDNKDDCRLTLIALIEKEETLVHRYYDAKRRRGTIKEKIKLDDYNSKCNLNEVVVSIQLIMDKLIILQKHRSYRAKREPDESPPSSDPLDYERLLRDFHTFFLGNKTMVDSNEVKILYTALEEKIHQIAGTKEINLLHSRISPRSEIEDFELETFIAHLNSLTGANNSSNILYYIREKKIPIITAKIKVIEKVLRKPDQYRVPNFDTLESDYKMQKNKARAEEMNVEKEYYDDRLGRKPEVIIDPTKQNIRAICERVIFFIPPLLLYFAYRSDWLSRWVQLSSSSWKNISLIMSVAHICMHGSFLIRNEKGAVTV